MDGMDREGEGVRFRDPVLELVGQHGTLLGVETACRCGDGGAQVAASLEPARRGAEAVRQNRRVQAGERIPQFGITVAGSYRRSFPTRKPSGPQPLWRH